MAGNYGRDRHRRLTADQANFLYVRAEGKCEKCGVELDAKWHGAHGIAWSNGGATTIDQMQAQCAKCNLKNGRHDEDWTGKITLRDWQSIAIPVLEETIFQQGFATLYAAPGAGKTIAAIVIFKHLYDAEIVKRVVVWVPNLAIVDQWKETFSRFQIHLDDAPRDNHIEHPQTVGLVATYHSLKHSTAQCHATDFKNVPTMVIFDEVHHIAENKKWGNATKTAVGDIIRGELLPEAVLNITGTLFRSDKSLRISTVKYKVVQNAKVQAIADFTIPTVSLIGRELRPVDVYVYGGEANIIDLREDQSIVGEICDLDELHRRTVLRDALDISEWRAGFVKEVLRRHERLLLSVDYKLPLKVLFVASSQRHAKLLADEVDRQTHQGFAHLIISERPEAVRELHRARRTDQPSAYITVNMVTEGFDDPNICTLGYCSNVTAPLRIAQIMARGMRLTKFERDRQQHLPMAIVIMDDAELRKAFAAALASTTHEVVDDQDDAKVYRGSHSPIMRRFVLVDLADPRFDRATVLGHEDGDVSPIEINHYEPLCQANGIPLIWTPRIALIARGERPHRQYYSQPSTTKTEAANPRDTNTAWNSRVGELYRLMAVHIQHDPRYADIRQFQRLANEAAKLNGGERREANSDQLNVIYLWMHSRIQEHYRDFCTEVMPEYLNKGL